MNKNSKKFKETDIGFIPKEWKIALLGKCSLLLGGKRLPKGDSLVEYKTHHPYIRITDFLEYGVDEKKIKFITPEVHNKIKKYIINEGDIYISNVGTIGLVGVIKGKMSGANLTENAVRITKFNGVNNYFLYYYLKSTIGQEQIKQNTVGAVQPKLPIYGISNIKIILPDILEQERIAEILSSLDDKIELNRKINSNLEKIASLLFKQWVVDSEQKSKDGCKIGKVSDLIRVESGFPFHSSMFDEGGDYKLVTIKNVQDGFFVPDCTNSLSEIPTKVPTHCRLNNGDILLSLTGNVGRVCFVYGENYLLNQRVANLVPIDENNRAFIYFLFRQKDFQNTLIGISRGTAQQNLSPIETKSLEITIPSQDALDRFANVANPIFQKLVENYNEIKNLSLLRDSLLPRLMNGKIRVK